jgi:hypothetical protein
MDLLLSQLICLLQILLELENSFILLCHVLLSLIKFLDHFMLDLGELFCFILHMLLHIIFCLFHLVDVILQMSDLRLLDINLFGHLLLLFLLLFEAHQLLLQVFDFGAELPVYDLGLL